MIHTHQNPRYSAEQLPDYTTTVQGCALSVYELYRKMIVGSIDAAGYVRQVAFDDKPDIDHPDPLNSFGVDLSTAFELQRMASEVARKEMRKASLSKKSCESRAVTPEEPVTNETGAAVE